MEIEKKISTLQSRIRSHVAFTKSLLRTFSPGSVDAKNGRQRNIEKVSKSTLERWKPLAEKSISLLSQGHRRTSKKAILSIYLFFILSDIDFCLMLY